MVSLCLSNQDATIDVQYQMFGSPWVVTWPLLEVEFWSWHFKVKLHMSRRALTREARWNKGHLPIFPILKGMFGKPFSKKYHHFDLDDLWSLVQFSSVYFGNIITKVIQYNKGLAQKLGLSCSASPEGEIQHKYNQTENKSRRPRYQPAEQLLRNRAARHGQQQPDQCGDQCRCCSC